MPVFSVEFVQDEGQRDRAESADHGRESLLSVCHSGHSAHHPSTQRFRRRNACTGGSRTMLHCFNQLLSHFLKNQTLKTIFKLKKGL